MKAIMTVLAGVAMVTVSAGAVSAETLEVKVPFAFTVGDTQLPAGVYRIERNFDTSPSLVRVRGAHGAAELFVQTTPLAGANAMGASALVFVPDESENRLTMIFESNGTAREVSAPQRRPSEAVSLIVVKGLRTS